MNVRIDTLARAGCRLRGLTSAIGAASKPCDAIHIGIDWIEIRRGQTLGA
jgi:hypothetical protein